MNVIFLNTWHGTLRTELRTYVQHHLQTADIFCFQEAKPEDRAPYEDLLADDFVFHAVRRDDVNGNGYGNIIYVRKDIPVLETGGLFVDEFEIGLAAYLTVKVNDALVTVCNVHGIPHPGDKLDSAARIRQSQTILDAFADRHNVIIGGDFNLLPETKSVQLFNEYGYQNLIADFNIATTRNRITYEKYPNNIQYYADYAFVSSSVQVTGFVVPEEIVSDHQPLELTVEVIRGVDSIDIPDVLETSAAM